MRLSNMDIHAIDACEQNIKYINESFLIYNI